MLYRYDCQNRHDGDVEDQNQIHEESEVQKVRSEESHQYYNGQSDDADNSCSSRLNIIHLGNLKFWSLPGRCRILVLQQEYSKSGETECGKRLLHKHWLCWTMR